MCRRRRIAISILLLATIGTLAVGRVQNDQFGLFKPDEQSASLERVALEPVSGQVLSGFRVKVIRPVTPFYLTQLVSPFDSPVAAGDRLKLSFWARSTTEGSHPVRVTVEMSQAPFEAAVDDMPVFQANWKHYELTGISRRDYSAGGLSVHFQVGVKAGLVELAGITAKDLGVDAEITKARQAIAPAEIAARIKRYRMTDLCVKVVDSKGRPVRAATVSVNQVRHEFLFGCNIFALVPSDHSDPAQLAYQTRFAALLNYATLPFYWGAFEQTPGHKDFARLEEMAAWCQAHGIECKGHPLAWHQVYPDWAPKDDSVVPILKSRIEEIVRTCSDNVHYYDVFNEINDAASTDTGVGAWVKKVGKAVALETALDWARNADPGRPHVFLYNDYQTSSATTDLLATLKQDGKLPDAIGIQSHMHAGRWPMEVLWSTAERFAQFGRPIHFTETTVLSGPQRNDVDDNHLPTDWVTTPEMEKVQADYVEQFYTVLFSHPALKAITWWDLSDNNAWRNAPAGLLRKDMSPKPAYDRLYSLIHGKWWTKAQGATSATGQYKDRVFRGIQRITVKIGAKTRFEKEVKVTGDAPQTVVVKL